MCLKFQWICSSSKNLFFSLNGSHNLSKIFDISMQCRYIGDISPILSDFFLFFAQLIIDAQYRVRIDRHPKYRRYILDISRHFKPCSQGKSIVRLSFSKDISRHFKPYSQGKSKVRLLFSKVTFESQVFLDRIYGDIRGHIHPPCGAFHYFMVLIDTSTRWSHVFLLSTQNVAFARLLAQMIKSRAQFLDYPIKTIILDNVGEFTSQTFTDSCMSVGINVEYHVAHTHTQNGLVESLIKHLQLIARSLLMKTKLLTSSWEHAIMNAASLVRIQPIAYKENSHSQLILGKKPNISYLQIFGCVVHIPITPT